MTKKQFLLDNFFLFKNVNDKIIDNLLTHNGIIEEKFKSGEIMQNSSLSSKLYIISKGKAIIKSGEDGVIIRKLSKNDVFGVAALYDPPKHLTIVKSVTECTVISMTKEFVDFCIKNDSNIAFNYIEFLSKRISFLNSKINAYTAKSAENKLYSYLLQLPRNGNTVFLPTDMSTLAKMIGIGRATLYRAFEKLETSGLITKNNKNIIINEV